MFQPICLQSIGSWDKKVVFYPFYILFYDVFHNLELFATIFGQNRLGTRQICNQIY